LYLNQHWILENRQKVTLNIVWKMSVAVKDDVTKRLSDPTVESSGVSFEGKSLKLDTEDDGNYYYYS
jgi:hypothetical protein